MFWETDHTFFASVLANRLLHPFLEDEVRVEELSALSSKSVSDRDRFFSVKLELGTTIVLPQNDWWSSLWRCG